MSLNFEALQLPLQLVPCHWSPENSLLQRISCNFPWANHTESQVAIGNSIQWAKSSFTHWAIADAGQGLARAIRYNAQRGKSILQGRVPRVAYIPVLKMVCPWIRTTNDAAISAFLPATVTFTVLSFFCNPHCLQYWPRPLACGINRPRDRFPE